MYLYDLCYFSAHDDCRGKPPSPRLRDRSTGCLLARGSEVFSFFFCFFFVNLERLGALTGFRRGFQNGSEYGNWFRSCVHASSRRQLLSVTALMTFFSRLDCTYSINTANRVLLDYYRDNSLLLFQLPQPPPASLLPSQPPLQPTIRMRETES
jgi:hypothetical protein